MKIYYTLILSLLILVSSCAKPTGYTQRGSFWGNTYGCSDKKISDSEFAIIAEGNEYSTPDHVAKLALYHAANVTIKNGKSSFYILKKTDENLPSARILTIPIFIGGASFFLPVAESSINETTSILIIQLCEEQAETQYKCINAEQVINELKPTL